MKQEYIKLKNFNSSEILRLAEYLKKFSNDVEQNFLLTHLGNFFLDLSVQQEVELSDAIDNKDNNAISDFISKNPDILVDITGTSKNKEPDGWKVKVEALNTSYTLAKSSKRKTSKIKQIIKARELTCLVNERVGNYHITRMSSGILDIYDVKVIDKYEQILKDKFNIQLFLNKLFSYYKKTHFTFFVEYVFYYLDVLCADVNNESDLTKEYIDTINSIINQD